jgi:hypothetical protein
MSWRRTVRNSVCLPRSGCPDTVKAWIDELAVHFKEVDPNHLVRYSTNIEPQSPHPWEPRLQLLTQHRSVINCHLVPGRENMATRRHDPQPTARQCKNAFTQRQARDRKLCICLSWQKVVLHT